MHTVLVLYEKHKEKADVLLEKAEVELKKHFEVLHEKVLSKVPGSFKDMKVA